MSLAQDANSRSALTVLVRVQKLTVPLPGDVRMTTSLGPEERRAMALPVCSVCNVGMPFAPRAGCPVAR